MMSVGSSQHDAVIIVDHGSRQAASNAMLLEVVELFRSAAPYAIVEPAHMEIAAPSIGAAFDRCVAAGARRVIINPFFLLPGRHWQQDIPRLAAEAAARHPGVEHLVTAPLGLHPLLAEVMRQRISHCLEHAAGKAAPCELCRGLGSDCGFRGATFDA